MGRAPPTDGRCRSRGTRRKMAADEQDACSHRATDRGGVPLRRRSAHRTDMQTKDAVLGEPGGALELELQLGPPLLVGLLGQAKIGLSGADLLDGAPERVETQGIDAALIQPYSGHASRESLVEIYSRLALTDAQHSYDNVIGPLPRLKDPPSWRPATRSRVPGRRGRSLGVAVGQVLDEVQHQGQPGTHAPAPIPVSTVTATSRATPLRTARRTRPAGSTAGDVDAARPRSC